MGQIFYFIWKVQKIKKTGVGGFKQVWVFLILLGLNQKVKFCQEMTSQVVKTLENAENLSISLIGLNYLLY